MAEREIFRLIVRAVGMIALGLGLVTIVGSALSACGLPPPAGMSPLQELRGGLAYFVGGLAILGASGAIVKAIYRSNR